MEKKLGTPTFEDNESLEDILRKKAKAKLDDEKKRQQEQELYAKILDEERALREPLLAMEEVTIDLPAFATHLTVDGARYYHGDIKPMSHAVAMSVREQMARMWDQEKLAGNPNLKDYKPVKEAVFSAKHGY